jgi:hypothetical protein
MRMETALWAGFLRMCLLVEDQATLRELFQAMLTDNW